jgi:hypothetical protein
MKPVYCVVRTGSLNEAICASSLKGKSACSIVTVNRTCVGTAFVRNIHGILCIEPMFIMKDRGLEDVD